ncbi:WRKY domain [Dillenia turbinata]|uniref:WRKY domain n=1 Tax=Dillenia turbinata TaxID=194707 RepID=A0AAN8W6I4_9MAGN
MEEKKQNQSFKAQIKPNENEEEEGEEDDHDDDEEEEGEEEYDDDDDDEGDDVVGVSESETLTVLSDRREGLGFSVNQDSDASMNSASQMIDSSLFQTVWYTTTIKSGIYSFFKGKVGVSHQELLRRVTSQAAQTQKKVQLQSSLVQTTSSDLSPASVTQSASSARSSTLLEKRQMPGLSVESVHVPKAGLLESSDAKIISSSPIVKTPDGFNWRKYGQKQVKSPKGFRSYYRCTYTDCHAKKVECCHHSGCVLEITYKGQHNHDPPSKVNCPRESRLAMGNKGSDDSSTPHSIRMPNDIDLSSSPKRIREQESLSVPEGKQRNSNGLDGNDEINIKEEHVEEPETKRRQVAHGLCFLIFHSLISLHSFQSSRVKKSSSTPSTSPSKPGKKPKFVVHAAGDMGISSDGYRWRKYGQKMVKGNPHPRNYYRCTSAGCPVRKHIERAVDNTSGVIITYKGIHDHDMPVPKKRHGPPSAPLVAAAAPASMNNLQLAIADAVPNPQSAITTQWSVDPKGELTGEAVELGGDKTVESARTLLSIGFEIKPC